MTQTEKLEKMLEQYNDPHLWREQKCTLPTAIKEWALEIVGKDIIHFDNIDDPLIQSSIFNYNKAKQEIRDRINE